jgi:hypothetical protein
MEAAVNLTGQFPARGAQRATTDKMSWTENQAGWPPNVEAPHWTASDAVGFAWKVVKNDGVSVVVPIVLAQLIAALPMMVLIGLQTAHTMPTILAHQIPDPLDPVVLGLQAATQVATWLSFGFINGGVYRFALLAARGEPRTFGDVFSGGRWFAASLTLMALAGLISLPATVVPIVMRVQAAPQALSFPVMMLLLIPGFLVTLGWSMALPLIVDRGMGGVEAIKESWRITTGQRFNIFVTMLLLGLVILGGCCLCGVGAVIGAAITPIAIAFIYLRLTGQPVASTES